MGLSDGQGTAHKLHCLVIEACEYSVKIYNMAIFEKLLESSTLRYSDLA